MCNARRGLRPHARSSQKPLRAPLAITILHVIRDVIYPYVSLILSETLGTRQLQTNDWAEILSHIINYYTFSMYSRS